MHPCKSFTDDLGGETYLDSRGKSPAENLPIIQYPLSISYDYIMSNIHVESFLLMVLFSCREAARPPPRCWMPQRFTFAKEFFQKQFFFYLGKPVLLPNRIFLDNV